MRIVFMGTPAFAVLALEALLHSEHDVAGVYTQPDRPAGRGGETVPSPVKTIALEHNIPVFQPEKLRGDDELERLAQLKPDVIVVSAFGQILSRQALQIPKHGCLNIHPSLLPKYRGASPVAGAILSGDEKTGVTIMLMDAGMDTGPIVRQIEFPISPDDTTGSLTEKLARAGARLLLDTLPDWFNGKITPQPQDESKATYTKPVVKADGEIDWRLDAITISRRVRAFQPWPGCYSWWRGKTLKIIKAVPVARPAAHTPGMVVVLTEDPAEVGVETGDGILGLHAIQMEGKRALPANEFLRGQKDFIGSILGKAQ